MSCGTVRLANLLDFERVRESGCHQVWMRDRSQTDKLNPAVNWSAIAAGYGERQPCFSCAAGTSQAQKPNIRSEQQLGGFCQLLFSSDERSTRDLADRGASWELCRRRLTIVR